MSVNFVRYDDLTDYRNLKFMHIMLDILEPLGKLTKIAETQKVTFPQLYDWYQIQVANLKSLLTSEGKHEKRFSKLIENSADRPKNSDPLPEYVMFAGHKLKMLKTSVTRTESAKRAFINAVLKDLESRFEGMNILVIIYKGNVVCFVFEILLKNQKVFVPCGNSCPRTKLKIQILKFWPLHTDWILSN